ncbi:MAG: hypothetical protein IT318_03670, partial [Anaerolineales bacterium]|nr:hypothetical protein [Anaerolineales bacterium]
MIIVLLIVFQSAFNPASDPVATASEPGEATPSDQQGYPASALAPTLAPTLPLETELAEKTASPPPPLPTPTPSYIVGSQEIVDPGGQFRFQLLDGWWARTHEYSSAILTNYDPDTRVHGLEAGELKMVIGLSRLEPGQSFDDWLAAALAATGYPPDEISPTVVKTIPEPYELNGYPGATYETLAEHTSQTIAVQVDAERILVVSLTPSIDSPAKAQAFQMLASLEMLPDPIH